jgi:hypothetical protein
MPTEDKDRLRARLLLPPQPARSTSRQKFLQKYLGSTRARIRAAIGFLAAIVGLGDWAWTVYQNTIPDVTARDSETDSTFLLPFIVQNKSSPPQRCRRSSQKEIGRRRGPKLGPERSKARAGFGPPLGSAPRARGWRTKMVNARVEESDHRRVVQAHPVARTGSGGWRSAARSRAWPAKVANASLNVTRL